MKYFLKMNMDMYLKSVLGDFSLNESANIFEKFVKFFLKNIFGRVLQIFF